MAVGGRKPWAAELAVVGWTQGGTAGREGGARGRRHGAGGGGERWRRQARPRTGWWVGRR
eukprot:scaffold114673_cov14-Tisochrysis_lutea.AAC.1